MATKSILKTIHIKNRRSANALAQALENANKKKAKVVVMTRTYSNASREEIRKIFEGDDEGVQDS